MVGITIGLFVKVCGAIGVTSSASTLGCTMGPPAARLYAVEPVGLAMTNPSRLATHDELVTDRDRELNNVGQCRFPQHHVVEDQPVRDDLIVVG